LVDFSWKIKLLKMELETEEDEIGVQSVVEMETEDEDLPFPGFQKISIRCLTQTHPLRHTCLRMITNPYPFSYKQNA
jgi:hypothetical protein